MKDLSKAKWNLSSQEQGAIKWLENNNFDVVLEKQYITKTIFKVTKDNFTDTLELPQGLNFNVQSYMEQYRKQFQMAFELNKLKGNK